MGIAVYAPDLQSRPTVRIVARADSRRRANAIGKAASQPKDAARAVVTGNASDASTNPGAAGARIRIAPENLKDFDTAFTFLSQQAQTAIIAEAAPLHPTLDSAAPIALWKSLTAGQGGAPPGSVVVLPFRQVLDAVAAAFDYDVVPEFLTADGAPVSRPEDGAAPAAYLLKKRYSDPRDFPFVTYDEVLYSLTKIDRALDPLNPHAPDYGPEAPLPRFARSFKPEQLHYNLARNYYGTGGYIPIRSLTPQQQRDLADYEESLYIQKRAEATGLGVDDLKLARTSPRAVYRRMDFMGSGIMVFGFEAPFGPRHSIGQYCLSHGSVLQLPNGATALFDKSGVMICGADMVTGFSANPLGDPNMPPQDTYRVKIFRDAILAAKANGDLSDPLQPTPADYTPASDSRLTTTIGKAVAGRFPGVRPLATVDPILAPKTVTPFGGDRLTPAQSLQALADVYGHRVVAREDGAALLTMRSAPVVQDVSDLVPAVRALYPDALLRYQTGVVNAEAERIDAADRAGDTTVGINMPRWVPKMNRDFMIHQKAVQNCGGRIYSAIVHRLRVLVEPQVDKTPDGRLPIGQSGAEALRLFALLLATGSHAHSPSEFLTSPIPRQMTNFRTAAVELVLTPKDNGIAIGWAVPKPDGTWQGVAVDSTQDSIVKVTELPALAGRQPEQDGASQPQR